MEGYQPSGFSYQVRTKSGSVRRELRQHEELAQFEASDDGAAAKSGNVVFVAVSNALDETMHSQAFEMSGYLARGQAGELALDVEMAKAGDHVLAAYQSEQERPVIVAEEVDALVSSTSVLFGSADLVEGLCANRGIVQRADEFEVPTIGGGNEPAQVAEAVNSLF